MDRAREGGVGRWGATTARARVEKAGGTCLTFDQLAGASLALQCYIFALVLNTGLEIIDDAVLFPEVVLAPGVS